MYISKGTVNLSKEADRHYNIIHDEMRLLSDTSHMVWHFVVDEAYVRERRISFGEGMIAGLAIGGITYVGNKIYTKHKSTQKKSEES